MNCGEKVVQISMSIKWCCCCICIVGEQVEKERIKFKKQMDEMNNKLNTAKCELAQSKKAEQLLVEQQNQMSIELIAEKREREKATMEMRRWTEIVYKLYGTSF